ncbi:MAG: EAL domain-containing protein [Candidatus Pelethousia sp.]|nr:EAL domain-containing protein [Candidatus Pelethousia sp.]
MLPKEQVVIEILEKVRPTEDVVLACRKLKEIGYFLALDDFVLGSDTESYLPLIELCDIIKVEFLSVTGAGMRRLIGRYKNRITFLAEKVETAEEYRRAADMGFTLFQGYFFSRPQISNAREIGSLNVNLLRVL